MLIRLGHSPDPDDAFMFWALAAGAIDTRGFEFEHVMQDIQTLSEWALEGRLETTAMSLASYPLVQDKYAILPHGASMGSGYGPVVVGKRELSRDELLRDGGRRSRRDDDGVPHVAPLPRRAFPFRSLPFDEILDEVLDGRAEAGLLIHEGQLTYASLGLGEVGRSRRVVAARDGLAAAARDQRRAARPRRGEAARPVGGAARVDPAGLANRKEAMQYAMQFGRGLDEGLADRFVGMYVNELTEDYGDEGREAVRELLGRAEALGVYDRPVQVDFIA